MKGFLTCTITLISVAAELQRNSYENHGDGNLRKSNNLILKRDTQALTTKSPKEDKAPKTTKAPKKTKAPKPAQKEMKKSSSPTNAPTSSTTTAQPTKDQYPNCKISGRSRLGDGWCDQDLNIAICGWDAGDCPVKYPECEFTFDEKFGDGYCDRIFNTKECGWDDGDCEVDCHGAGNGLCESEFNNEDCNFDGNDCAWFNSLYPYCGVSRPYLLGDGNCDVALGSYNTSDCGFDAGDCLVVNNSTNTTAFDVRKMRRSLFESVLNYLYPQAEDEILEWQK